MIPLSAAAEAALDDLLRHYEMLGRDRAIDRLAASLETACTRYEHGEGRFFDAPRPYPALSGLGFRWAKEASYWIAFAETGTGPVVAGIFHEAADIPGRI